MHDNKTRQTTTAVVNQREEPIGHNCQATPNSKLQDLVSQAELNGDMHQPF